MPEYTLSATPRAREARGPRPQGEGITFEAKDDTEATYEAIKQIMDRAYPNVEPWAHGAIVLACGQRIVAKMGSKKEEDAG